MSTGGSELPAMQPRGMNGETGVYLKGTALTRARDLLELALHTPPIHRVAGEIDLQTKAYLAAKEYVTDQAVELGLPVIAGYYGLNPNTGEILS
jgi:hypothetical protein